MKRYGVFGIYSLIMWTSPSWLAFFIPSLADFALIWLGLVISPILPMWLAIPLTAVFLYWLWQWIKAAYRKIRDWIRKAGYGTMLFTLYDVDEIELILRKGEQMKHKKDTDMWYFKKKQKEERLELIKEHWEETIEEAENDG